MAMLGAQHLDWEEVKSFAVVADAGSVRRAARALGVHHSTVSRRIDNLEYALGTKLFDRQPEGFVLNAAGEEFVTAVRDCGVRLNGAERSISGQDGDMSGVVTVTMAEPIAVHTFGPRLSEFTDMHPGIEVHMIATTSILDVSRREADIAIRIDNNPPQSLVGKRIITYNQTVYATQEYLDSQDFENDPETARWLAWDAGEDKFPDWTKETEFSKVPMWGCFPGAAMQLSAAKGGLGLAMVPCFIGDREPLLVRATKKKPIKARDIWLLTHSDLKRTARIKAFMTFAEKVLRDAKHEFLGTT
ncbi:MAG: LysR family transcriptional regulator [Parasphingorhabdus sp.]|uniref:LysR family transcriptional regulator n=1 Tax=Parasphingorhabdus sp. TaxID=2709688 RepID=UPI00329750A0